jgi:hypothetical protein
MFNTHIIILLLKKMTIENNISNFSINLKINILNN